MAIRRTDDLEIDQDLAFQRRAWIVQRAGWAAMGALLGLAVVGLLGSGPLSRHEVRTPDGLRVEYPRFARYETPETITVRVAPTASADVQVWVDRGYLERASVESVVPPPSRVEVAADRLVYVFPRHRRGEPVTITFRLQATRIGPASGRVGLVGGAAPAAFRQLVYP